MNAKPIRLGISRCLLGEQVRFDGRHKRDPFLVEVLGRHVEWVAVCPEVEAGLGIPREAMRLVGKPEQPRLITIRTNRDLTRPLDKFSQRRVRELKGEDLCGYVFKKDSPSCGIERVRLYDKHGMPGRAGVGIFARAIQEQFPLMPIEEEGRLCDPAIRENFIERVFAYDRWRSLLSAGVTRCALVSFHRIHKYLLLVHSETHYRSLGQIVAQTDRSRPKELALRYGTLFMEALVIKATVRKHVKVLHHLIGHFMVHLNQAEKAELLGVIDDYHRGLVPLVMAMTLVKHYAVRLEVSCVRDQIYLNPHPKELILRNHV